MDMTAIKTDWAHLAGKRMQFAHAFYENLFQRRPEFRKLFPDSMDTQMEHMIEMFSGISRFADHTELVRPYLNDVGFAHRRLGIHAADLDDFKQAFIETLAQHCAPGWNQDHADAWDEAFDSVVLPLFEEGLETGRRDDA